MTGVERVDGGHRAPPGSPPFPGGIAVTHLRVYDTEAPDGLVGGTPHCHTACTEAYAVVGGAGRVQTLAGDGFRETRVSAGSFVWFTPGTIHRLVNDSGDLEIWVLMQNAGLPEAGDMVIAFPDDVLADSRRYAAAAALAPPTERRDLGVEGFRALVAGGPDALAGFHRRAAALVQPKVDAWRATWQAGPKAAVDATAAHLAALARADAAHLAESGVWELPPPPAQRRLGCCGTLGTYVPAGP